VHYDHARLAPRHRHQPGHRAVRRLLREGQGFELRLVPGVAEPWWAIGLSAFGTAVDIGDYTAVAGGSYRFGLSQLAQWWLGISVGWFLVSFFVIVPAYRSGVFTNAEWLEFRFGPAAPVLAVLINTISRAARPRR
jgi:hypothetical protein